MKNLEDKRAMMWVYQSMSVAVKERV